MVDVAKPKRLTIKDLPIEELFTKGHTACAGCGGSMLARTAMKVFGKNTAVYSPACCLLVFGSTYPLSSWKVPYFHVAFENTAAVIAGMRAGFKAQGREGINVVGIAGDGGTADIGFQALSGAAERNDDTIYIMYDNEAYMNTGIQRSGSTPYGAWTTTTPVGTVRAGKREFKKDIPRLIADHEIPYLATASVGHPMDLLAKLEKAKNAKGFRYLQVFAPCPTGWKFDTALTVKMCKMAVDSGMWTLYEVENGVERVTYKPKQKIPVNDYIKPQGRFKHMTEDKIKELQAWVDKRWARYYGQEKSAATQQ